MMLCLFSFLLLNARYQKKEESKHIICVGNQANAPDECKEDVVEILTWRATINRIQEINERIIIIDFFEDTDITGQLGVESKIYPEIIALGYRPDKSGKKPVVTGTLDIVKTDQRLIITGEDYNFAENLNIIAHCSGRKLPIIETLETLHDNPIRLLSKVKSIDITYDHAISPSVPAFSTTLEVSNFPLFTYHTNKGRLAEK
ncbi:hypothetical protein TRFO_02640 [Tritrichomonas foetus]|uniref:Uncharacterized protein n=1 Tax=Tritrichomonas foetus TaxID=1144522 RepID=A0A1J4KZ23_9EUKA|nr:hypothetical protein TRFO_02640 [Tritrichomonas foetus]|eukprot:OHT16402.1 hypothetical protein TRFO_02640 [Tritrichomonas foetus]